MVTIWAIIPLVSAIVYVAVLVLVLHARRQRVHHIFAIYLGTAATWSFFSFMLHLNAFPQQAILWNEILIIALIWTVLNYYHFIRAYNQKPGGLVLYLGYIYLLALAGFTFSGRIVKSAYVVDGVLYHDLGISLYFIGAISLFLIGAIMFHLVQRYRRSSDPVDRNRTAYLMTGWGIVIVYGYTNLIPDPLVAGRPIDHLGNLANALIIAYAILKYRLLNIKLVFQRGLSYSGLTVFLTAIYLLLLFILQRFFQGWTGYNSLALAAAFALVVAILFNTLRNFIQKWLERLIYRETYNYRRMLLTFSDKISNVLDLAELAQSMLEPVIKAMRSGRAALLFPETESGDFHTHFALQASDDAAPLDLRLAQDNPIVTWLAQKGGAFRQEHIDFTPELKGLWHAERLALEELGVELLLPVRSKGSLIGILAVGKKQSDDRYTDEEVDLLLTMANEAAVVAENARMLDSLKKQQLRVSQLLTQVVQAQEEERKRISVDLHDGVAQWLAAAFYQAQSFGAMLTGHNSGNNKEETRDELATMEDTLDKSLKELRRVVIGLRPPALDELGLNHALRQSLEGLKGDGLDCHFKITGTPVRLPSSMEIAIYRIVQEALTNVRKHAKATQVNLHLEYQADKLLVQVGDNGQGLDLARTLDSAISVGHMGLLGMKQRAETLGGDLRIMTSRGAGTTVVVTLPLQHPTEAG